MRKKAMWIMIVLGSTIAEYYCGFFIGSVLAIPITVASWWIAYKSSWMDGLD